MKYKLVSPQVLAINNFVSNPPVATATTVRGLFCVPALGGVRRCVRA